jgi:osmotically-inducible protein OsmY
MKTMNTLQQRVEAALLDDPHTKESAIEVLNENGIITLSGIVSSHKTSEAAESIVKDFSGVVTVVNEIQVRKADGDSAFDVTGTFDDDMIVK